MKTQLTKLNRITARITKGTTPTTMGFDFIDYGVNYIKAEALNGDSELDTQSFSHISDDAHNKLKRSILQNNDVLVTIAGVNIGKVGIVKQKHLPANTNQAVGIVRVKSDLVNSSYIYYWFKNPLTFDYLQSINSQAAQPNINLEMLGNLSILLPDIQNQQKIALTITAYDDLINTNRRCIQLLEESARLLFREWFVYFRFPGHEKVKIVDGVPEGWKKVVLGNIAIRIKKNYSMIDEDLSLIDLARMNSRTLAVSDVGVSSDLETARIIFDKDDVLFSSIRPYLHKVVLAPFKGITNTSVFVVRAKNPIFRAYITLLLFSDYAIQFANVHSTGTKMPVVKWSSVSSLPALIPPQKIIEDFQNMVWPMLEQIQLIYFQNRKLAYARDLLLPRLMSGAMEV